MKVHEKEMVDIPGGCTGVTGSSEKRKTENVSIYSQPESKSVLRCNPRSPTNNCHLNAITGYNGLAFL